MATNPTGKVGALFDPIASNGLGGLNTLIGFGTNAIYKPRPAGMEEAEIAKIYVVGLGLASARNANACGSAGKALTYRTSDAAVANGAAVTPSLDLNKSGMAMLTGETVLAVAP